jgi:hypothetical protein
MSGRSTRPSFRPVSTPIPMSSAATLMRMHWQHADGWTGDRIAPLGAHPATLQHPRAGTRVRARLDAAATRVSWRIGRRPWQRASGTRRS